MTVGISFVINNDDITDSLQREATAAKDEKDWDRAIDCLRRVKERMRGYPIQSWLRLPSFLQQASRFDEAMREFHWLIGLVNARDERLIPEGSPYFLRHLAAVYLAEIHDKMRLACKREGLMVEAAHHAMTRDRYRDLRDKLEPFAENEWQADLIERQERKEK